jgi:hypothetical protein
LLSIVLTVQLLLGRAYVNGPRPRVLRVDQLNGKVVGGSEVSSVPDAGCGPGSSIAYTETDLHRCIIQLGVVTSKEVVSQRNRPILSALFYCDHASIVCEALLAVCVSCGRNPICSVIDHNFHGGHSGIQVRAVFLRYARTAVAARHVASARAVEAS